MVPSSKQVRRIQGHGILSYMDSPFSGTRRLGMTCSIAAKKARKGSGLDLDFDAGCSRWASSISRGAGGCGYRSHKETKQRPSVSHMETILVGLGDTSRAA